MAGDLDTNCPSPPLQPDSRVVDQHRSYAHDQHRTPPSPGDPHVYRRVRTRSPTLLGTFCHLHGVPILAPPVLGRDDVAAEDSGGRSSSVCAAHTTILAGSLCDTSSATRLSIVAAVTRCRPLLRVYSTNAAVEPPCQRRRDIRASSLASRKNPASNYIRQAETP